MSRSSVSVPEESDLLCEGCGYILNGLPGEGACPECGTPIAASVGEHRRPPRWEQERIFTAWVKDSREILLHPTRFFTAYASRGSMEAARRFAVAHWIIIALLLATAAYEHAIWSLLLMRSLPSDQVPWMLECGMVAMFSQAMVVLLMIVHKLAGKLTAWEANYRGMRMPREVVARALYYHSPHYLPVAVMGFLTATGNRWLVDRGLLGVESAQWYLYLLCIEVIAGAGYLFQTYWIAMRSIRYANR
jgi:hypothetical protein